MDVSRGGTIPGPTVCDGSGVQGAIFSVRACPCALVRARLVRARLVRIKDASYRCTRRSDIGQRGSFLVQVFFRGRVLPRSTGRSCLLMLEPATCGLGTHESCPKDRTPFDWQKPWSLGEETPDDTTARTQPARTQPAQVPLHRNADADLSGLGSRRLGSRSCVVRRFFAKGPWFLPIKGSSVLRAGLVCTQAASGRLRHQQTAAPSAPGQNPASEEHLHEK